MTVTAEDETTLGAASRASSAGGVGGSTAPGGAVGKQQQGGGGNSESVLPTAVEFEPPFACVRRILKNALPSSTNVGKDASAAFARATGGMSHNGEAEQCEEGSLRCHPGLTPISLLFLSLSLSLSLSPLSPILFSFQ
jgi:hypothetical protein